MKKIIYETIGNIIMFILLGLSITKGFTTIQKEGSLLLEGNYFTIIFIIYMIVYGISILIINKIQGPSKNHLFLGLKLHKDIDEREQHITDVASKTTYLAMMFVFPFMIFIPILLQKYATVTNANINFFDVSIWIPIVAVIILNTVFSLKWCIEYKNN